MNRSSHDPALHRRDDAEASPEKAARQRGFIALQAIFWIVFLAIRVGASWRLFPDLLWPFMGQRLAIVGAYAAATTLIHVIVNRFPSWTPVQRLWLTIGLCALTIVPMHALEVQLALQVMPSWPTTQFLDYFSQFGWVLLAWAGYHFALDFALEAQSQALAVERAHRDTHAAHMKMLRYQLNPHFLFNSLNAISTLVLEGRNKDAEGMLLRLSRFLRHTIDTDPTQLARLGDEAKVQQLYLEVEAVRFGDKLQVLCNVPEALNDCLVPTLLLQPIVENAIKHGVAKTSGGARIAISAAEDNGRLKLVVENDGAPFASGASGVGLRNTRDRLAAIYGDRASLEVTPRPNGGARAEFDLPLQRIAAS